MSHVQWQQVSSGGWLELAGRTIRSVLSSDNELASFSSAELNRLQFCTACADCH